MKKIVSLIAVIGLLLTLAACGSTDNEETTVPKNPTPEENTNEGTNENNRNSSEQGQNNEDMQKQMDELDYADFTLEVEYADQTEYEAELEKNSNQSVEAELKDSINNVNLKGKEAFDALYPLVQQLTIDQQTVKGDAISQTLEIFKLDEAYSKFELEIKFNDGTKIEFEDEK